MRYGTVPPVDSVPYSDCHPEVMAGSRFDNKDSGFGEEIAVETCRVGDALPGFNADERGSWLGPDAEIPCGRKAHFDARTAVCAVQHTSTGELIEDDDVPLKQVVSQ